MCSYVWAIEESNLFVSFYVLPCAEKWEKHSAYIYVCVCTCDAFEDPFLFSHIA